MDKKVDSTEDYEDLRLYYDQADLAIAHMMTELRRSGNNWWTQWTLKEYARHLKTLSDGFTESASTWMCRLLMFPTNSGTAACNYVSNV